MLDFKFIPAENPAVQRVIDLVPMLYDFFDEDISIAVGDTEKYLYNTGVGKMDIKCELGTAIPQKGAAMRALTTGQFASGNIPAAVYGFPFRSYAVPIRDGGQVVGVLCLAKSLERGDELARTAEALSSNMAEMVDVANGMANSIQELVSVNAMISQMMAATVETTENTGEILSFIQNISSKTKLLGLNASIEAARAGEAGRGFAVVASEIEKMSTSTTESVKKISEMLTELVRSNKEVQEKIDSSNSAFTEQAAAIEELVASLTELGQATAHLKSIAADF